jgi:hypothetical protein
MTRKRTVGLEKSHITFKEGKWTVLGSNLKFESLDEAIAYVKTRDLVKIEFDTPTDLTAITSRVGVQHPIGVRRTLLQSAVPAIIFAATILIALAIFLLWHF